ncbi:Heterokaryon incompatibility protein 6, OR allele 6 [Phlyctema vagabunda]|uniref:Heterokaryon incompatibility protein 6, OR allele 6 n=1 Tax=Phlyctema vagabunda TaxID=108571 RepID=A0ABR4PV65_9HELO
MHRFSYDDLDSVPGVQTIRLLELQCGAIDDELVCRIKTTSLRDHPDYEAISYCWGPSHVVDRVVCNNKTYLPLNQSLSSALKHFRHLEKPRLLWADAICIDQSNADEKSKQVNMMRDVYRQARRVLVWLGEEGEGEKVKPLVDFARKLATVDPSTLPADRLVRQNSLGFGDVHVRSLFCLLERPWFRRIWILQEVAVARETILYCGHKSLTWDTLCSIVRLESGVNMMGLNNQMVMDIIQGIDIQKNATDKSSPTALLHLLLRHRTSLSTDPRDKVYALLGLCTDGVLKANYRLPTREMHKLLTQHYLRQHCNLDIITVPSSPVLQQARAGPSWVPDWSATDVAFPLALRAQLFPDTDYRATGQSRWVPKFSEDGSMLGVEAQFIDEITVLGAVRRPYCPENPDLKTLFKRLRTDCAITVDWEKVCLADNTSYKDLYPTGESIFDVKWQIAVGGCSPADYQKCRRQSAKVCKLFTTYARMFKFMPLCAFVLVEAIVKLTGQPIFYRRILAETISNDFQFKIWRSVLHRRMLRTKNSYLGLAPALAQVGDRIALLKGLKTPAILRPRGGGTWEFVGDCYLHGIMNGEAFQEEWCADIWLR